MNRLHFSHNECKLYSLRRRLLKERRTKDGFHECQVEKGVTLMVFPLSTNTYTRSKFAKRRSRQVA